MKLNRWMGAAAALLVLVVGYTSFAVLERRAYSRAVREDAKARGYNPERMRYPAHWPLEYYSPALSHASGPGAAERLVLDADSVAYFVVPVRGTPADSALIQVFYLGVGRWTSAIQVTYRTDGQRVVEGGDFLPDRAHRRPREQALQWFSQDVAGAVRRIR
jgi:hypothetical protein